MPSNLPTNDMRRLILARRILSNARQDRRRRCPLLPVRYETAFQQITDDFDEALKQTAYARAEYAGCLERRDRVMPRLALETRSFIACLKHRLRRGVISPQVHAQYRVQPAAQRPHSPRERGWVLQASWLVEGEAWALEHGHPGVSEPDLQTLTNFLDLARSAMEAADAAEARWTHWQTKLRRLRKRLMKQLSRIQWALKSELKAQDRSPGTIRRVLHRYGFRSRRPALLPPNYFPWEREQIDAYPSLDLGFVVLNGDLPPPQ